MIPLIVDGHDERAPTGVTALLVNDADADRHLLREYLRDIAEPHDELLVNADLAMYDAKEEGRDRYAGYQEGEEHEPRITARLTWLQRVEAALDEDAFVLYAQPILDIHKNEVAHHELLIRMITPDRDIIPPATFLEIAERFGLVGRIDRWVTNQAVRYLHGRAADAAPLSFTVNLSGRTLGDGQSCRSSRRRSPSTRSTRAV